MTVLKTPDSGVLSWNNYRSVPRSLRPPLTAYTYIRIDPADLRPDLGTGANHVFRVSHLTIRVSVDLAQSWVVANGQTPTLLEHERLHYRIGILVAKELDAQAMAASAPSLAALNAAVQAVVNHAGTRLHTIGEAYDLATNHGRIGPSQKIWNGRVQGWEQNGRIVFP